ncbi:MAG: MaoC family dehydratase [Rhodobacter sp.]|nr:MaoC family dehydratase [Paracoccaceae bacterium]MCC0076363.1 MaoC family dehydratase [Rhodobacter sp.]
MSALADRIGEVVGASDWILLDQARIDAFADVTEDHQFIHVDPARAADSPFGGTIAHGFLTLSMLSRMAAQALPVLGEVRESLNYGFDKIRFLTPVPSGARVRGVFTLQGTEDKPGNRQMLRFAVAVEIEGTDRPALVADWLVMLIFGETK